MALFLLADPVMAAAFGAGRKTQLRVAAGSPLACCAPGDRIDVREPCIPARYKDGQLFATPLDKAAFVIFHDGWRQYRDGSGEPGKPPGDGHYEWITAMHMPSWAMRFRLVVDDLLYEPLQRISARDVRAEGARPLLGGLLWRWSRPWVGVHLSARRAFAAYWDISHPAAGQRWADDPSVAVLRVSMASPPLRVESEGETRVRPMSA